MTTTKTLADLPTLTARLAEALSEPPEFGARQPYGDGFKVCDAAVGYASIDVGLRAGTDEVTFAGITGVLTEQVCSDAVRLVAAVCDSDVETVAQRWPTLAQLGVTRESSGQVVLDDVRIDVWASRRGLGLSCEPA